MNVSNYRLLQIDKNIWRLIEEGDENAYEEMYRYYYRRFFIYGRKITVHLDTIEDSIQEVMIFIWHNRTALSEIKYPAAYFYTSFRNALVHKLKSFNETVSDEHIEEGVSSHFEQVIIAREESLEISSQLKKASSYLTARQSEAIFLRFYEELSYEEVAEVMGITVKATYKIVARALNELRNRFSIVYILLSQLAFLMQ